MIHQDTLRYMGQIFTNIKTCHYYRISYGQHLVINKALHFYSANHSKENSTLLVSNITRPSIPGLSSIGWAQNHQHRLFKSAGRPTSYNTKIWINSLVKEGPPVITPKFESIHLWRIVKYRIILGTKLSLKAPYWVWEDVDAGGLDVLLRALS